MWQWMSEWKMEPQQVPAILIDAGTATANQYQVENPLRNRSRVDLTGPDVLGEEF